MVRSRETAMASLSPLLVRFAAALALLFLVACAPPPGPKAPVRELPPPATSLLTLSPPTHGSPAPIALPDDPGSAAASKAPWEWTAGLPVGP